VYNPNAFGTILPSHNEPGQNHCNDRLRVGLPGCIYRLGRPYYSCPPHIGQLYGSSGVHTGNWRRISTWKIIYSWIPGRFFNSLIEKSYGLWSNVETAKYEVKVAGNQQIPFSVPHNISLTFQLFLMLWTEMQYLYMCFQLRDMQDMTPAAVATLWYFLNMH
jgi:hypothetical protein